MFIPSNKLDFVDYNVAKSFINKSIDTGLEKEKNQELGASILKVFKNLWHKTEVTFRQICSSFEEGWITNDTIKNRLITKIGQCSSEIDGITNGVALQEDAGLLQKMQTAQQTMLAKIQDMEKICALFEKRGDKGSAQSVNQQLQLLEAKVKNMLKPLELITSLKDQINKLQGTQDKLTQAKKELTKAKQVVADLQQDNPELALLKGELNKVQSERTKLAKELGALTSEKEIEKKEIEAKIQKLDDLVSESSKKIKEVASSNKDLIAANEKLTQALEQAQIAEGKHKKMLEAVEAEKEKVQKGANSDKTHLENELKRLEKSEKELQTTQEKLKNAEDVVKNLQQENSELVLLKGDLNEAQSEKVELLKELKTLASEKDIEHSQKKEIKAQKKEIEARIQELDNLVSKNTGKITQLTTANKELTQALEQAQIAESDYKKLLEVVEAERESVLKEATSNLNILESNLKTNESKLEESDKKIADQDKKIADLENQLIEAKKLLQKSDAELAAKSLVSPSQVKSKQEITQQKFIKVGKERERPNLEGLSTEGVFVEEPPQVSDEFPRVIDVTQLEDLSTTMLNFIGVANGKNLKLNYSRLSTVHWQFKQFDDEALVHAADFFKEIEGHLVRLGVAKWNEDETGIEIEKGHPEVKKAYGEVLKEFYKIRGAAYVKDVLPIKQRNAQHMHSQREKIELIETPFVSNLEKSITSLGHAMQKLVRAAGKSGLPVDDNIQEMISGPWDFETDTVVDATHIFTDIEASLVKKGMAKRDEKSVGVVIDKDKYPKLEKAYQNALAVYDAHIEDLHAFYSYDDLIHQNNQKLKRLILKAEHERSNEPINQKGREDLSQYDQIIDKFLTKGIEMSDNNILGVQSEILEAITKKYRIDKFPPDSEVAKFYKQADEGINHLEFTKNHHEGFKRGGDVDPEELRERRVQERTQKFEREFPTRRIEKSISEQPEKPIKKAALEDKYADYESRREDIQFKDPRTTSRDHRDFLRKEAERAAERSKVSVEQKNVLNAANALSRSIGQLNRDLKDLVRVAKEKNVLGNTGWNYNEEQFELFKKLKTVPSRKEVLKVTNDYLNLLREEFLASEIAVTHANDKDVVFNEDADPDLVSKYQTVMDDVKSVQEGMEGLKGVKEAKKLAKVKKGEERQLKGKVEKALKDLLEAAENYGMPRGNPLFEDQSELSDFLQDLTKFKEKGLRLKNDTLAVAANKIFKKIKNGLKNAGIDKNDDPKLAKVFSRVSNMLEELKTQLEIVE